MSRDPLHTVTPNLPVLIDAHSERESDGSATAFPDATRTRISLVRVFRDREAQTEAARFTSQEMRLYRGAALLSRAYEALDERALEQALEDLRPWIPSISGKLKFRTGGDRWAGARWIYSSVLSNAIQSARFVIWYPKDGDNGVLPSAALYCPNKHVAALALLALKRVRVCPKCEAIFIPASEKVDYCTPAHGVAYRTALSRWRKAQEAE